VIKVALRGIRANMLQFTLAVLSVVLGIAFISGTFSLRTMLASTFTDIIDTSLVGDAYVRGASEVPGDELAFDGSVAYNSIPLELAEEIQSLPQVERAIPDVTGPIVLVGADGTAVSQGAAPAMAFGMDPSDADLGISIVAGSPPRGPEEIALESASLQAADLEVGDKTKAILGGSLRDVTVVGEVDFDSASAGAVLAFLDSDTAREIYASDGMVESITVLGSDGVSSEEVTLALNDYLLQERGAQDAPATAVTGEEYRAAATDEMTEMLGFVEIFLLVFAAVSLFVGAFIIANTFAMSVRQRQAEFALLRAVGAASGQVFASVIAQAIAIGLLGASLGVGAGVGLVALLRLVFAQFGMEMSGSIPLTGQTVVISLIVGVIVTVGAALLPARRAALTAPVAAMRDSKVEIEKPLRVRGFIGGVALTIGASLITAALIDGGSAAGQLLGFGAAATVLAMLVLAPVLLRPIMGFVGRPFGWLIRPGGKLATRNLLRNRRRSATTASALMIGMALVGGATVIAASAQESLGGIVDDESNSDLIIQSTAGPIPSEAVNALQQLPAVGQADPFMLGAVKIAEDSVPIAGFPLRGHDPTWNFDQIEGSIADLGSGEVAAHVESADEFNWSVGDEVAMSGAAGAKTVRIGAIVDSQGLSGPALFVPPPVFTEVISQPAQTTHMMFLRASADYTVDELREEVIDVAQPYVVLSVQDNAEFADDLANQVNQVLVLLYGLLGLAIVIAVLGVANTLALSIIDRTNEVGLLRAVGMGRTQLMGVVTIESLLTALFGALVGLAVGVGLAAAMPRVFADMGFSRLVIPWPALGALLVVAVVGGLAAALWPAIRAMRLPVLDAITAP